MPHASKLYSSLTVYQPPLTPVSEADSDTTETASSSNATGSSVTSPGSATSPSYFKRPLNFSRPRPSDFSPGNRVRHDSTHSKLHRTHSLEGFSKSTCDLPAEPCFDLDFDPDSSSAATTPDAFSWDEQLRDMRPLRRHQYEAQRSHPRELYRPSTSASLPVELLGIEPEVHVRLPTRPATAPEARQPLVRAYSAPAPKKVIPPQHIKPDPDEDEWEGEDARSHHTVSEMDEDDILARKEEWKSSIFDVSALSSGEIKKLKKKGINPSLYAEMKAVRRGKGKWINPLVGNSYLS